jgi:hypothetical protein
MCYFMAEKLIQAAVYPAMTSVPYVSKCDLLNRAVNTFPFFFINTFET